jgi:hypothetical protein
LSSAVSSGVLAIRNPFKPFPSPVGAEGKSGSIDDVTHPAAIIPRQEIPSSQGRGRIDPVFSAVDDYAEDSMIRQRRRHTGYNLTIALGRQRDQACLNARFAEHDRQELTLILTVAEAIGQHAGRRMRREIMLFAG